MTVSRVLTSGWSRGVVWLLCLSPALLLTWRGFHNNLGANPIEFITHATGDWTLRFLLITLSITPLRRILGMPDLIKYRRLVGLFAFFYGFLHLVTYVWLDKFFEWMEIVTDVAKRPFITAGFVAFLLMAPLAATSTMGWIRRLGGKRWQRLHRLIYGSAVAGVIHYYWLVKSDIRQPVFYGSLVLLLLSFRVAASWLRRKRRPMPAGSKVPGSDYIQAR